MIKLKKLLEASGDANLAGSAERGSFNFHIGKTSPTEKDDVIPGGKADMMDDEQFDKDQLEIGIAVEMEHTNDRDMAKEIAKDHLQEHPDYYTRLIKAGLVDEPEAINLYKKLKN